MEEDFPRKLLRQPLLSPDVSELNVKEFCLRKLLDQLLLSPDVSFLGTGCSFVITLGFTFRFLLWLYL